MREPLQYSQNGLEFKAVILGAMVKEFLRGAVPLALAAAVLHGLWEALHLPLYTGYGALGGPLPVEVYATTGDVLYTLLVALGVALYKRDAGWIRRAGAGEYLALAFAGLIVAVFVEYKAMLLGLWAYAPAMPTILGFGLSPLAQMTILLPLSVSIARWFIVRIDK